MLSYEGQFFGIGVFSLNFSCIFHLSKTVYYSALVIVINEIWKHNSDRN